MNAKKLWLSLWRPKVRQHPAWVDAWDRRAVTASKTLQHGSAFFLYMTPCSAARRSALVERSARSRRRRWFQQLSSRMALRRSSWRDCTKVSTQDFLIYVTVNLCNSKLYILRSARRIPVIDLKEYHSVMYIYIYIYIYS